MSRRGRKQRWEVADMSKASLRPLRRGGQLETICENNPSSENDSGDKFDKLCKSPMKRDVDFKPLSFWKQKVEMLEEKDKKPSCKGLYELSSPDDSCSSSKKTYKKIKPRKKKENLLDNLIKKASCTKKAKNEVEPAWERLILKQSGTDSNVLLSNNQPPFYGLSSTPGKKMRHNTVKPSYFDFVSPIVENGNTTVSSLFKSKQGDSLEQVAVVKDEMDDDVSTPKRPIRDTSEIKRIATLPNDSKLTDTLSVAQNENSNEINEGGFLGFSPSDVCEPENWSIYRNVTLRKKNRNVKLLTENIDSHQEEHPECDLFKRNVTLRKKKPPVKLDASEGEQSSDFQKAQTITNVAENITTSEDEKTTYFDAEQCSPPTISSPSLHSASPISSADVIFSTEPSSEESDESTRKSVGHQTVSSVLESPSLPFDYFVTKRKKSNNSSRCSTLSENETLVKEQEDNISLTFAQEPTPDADDEKSHYFSSNPVTTVICETASESSDDSLICNSSPEKVQKNAKIDSCHFSPNKTLLPTGPVVLKGGKGHTRALSLLRQINAGRLTLANQAPAARGRGYESFLGNLLPAIGLDRSNLTCLNDTRMNKTVRWQDSMTPKRRMTVRGNLQESRMDKSHFGNATICVVATEDHVPTEFRSAYGIKDQGNQLTCTAREATLSRCGQTEPVDFSEHFNEETLPECEKIGEGVYGEVFMYRSKVYGRSVFKVIPIEGDLLFNGEPQKTFEEILSEVVITMELSNLRQGTSQSCSGFAELRRCLCVKGEYPELLLDLWHDYDCRKGSENDSPSMFKGEQLYMILELAHGGTDLEAFVFLNAKQSAAAFRQAALSLAVAEKSLQFEHRDFHWGNVLISETNEKKVKYVIDGKERVIPTEGVKVTIIDFTLSRMTYEGCAIFNDLSLDPGLFTSEGDYQFDIYRMMKEETGDNWENFHPRTNIFWLHYTVDKMSTIVRYSRPSSQIHKAALQKMRLWKKNLLDHGGAAELNFLL